MHHDMQGIFLILAATVALRSGKGVNKSLGMNNYSSRPQIAIEQNLNPEELTAEKCALLQSEAEKVLADLEIQNLQGKSVEEQKQAVYQILKHICYTTSKFDVTPEDRQEQVDNQELDAVYKSLCEHRMVKTWTAESMTLAYLYDLCGLDSEYVEMQKPRHPERVRGVVTVKLNDGKSYFVDPVQYRNYGSNTKSHNKYEGVVHSMEFFAKSYQDYEPVSHYPINKQAIMAETQTQSNNLDTTMER